MKMQTMYSYYRWNGEILSSYLLSFHYWNAPRGLLHLNYFLFLTFKYIESDDPILKQSFVCSLLDCICIVWTLYLNIVRKSCNLLVLTRSFHIEKTTIFVFFFWYRIVTQLNQSALGILKHNYITKRTREMLIGNSRILIQNLLN